MKRLLVTLSFGLLLGAGLLITSGEAQPNTVKEVVKGVWFREGDIEHAGHCNNAIIEMKDYLIVIDANFPSGARAVLQDAKKVSSKPVKYVFDTHHHGDHAYGNAVWTKAGAITLAYAAVTEELQRYEPGRWKDTAKSRKDVGDLKLATAETPKQTFTESPFVMKDETRTVEFHFFGWAHTRGDGFAYLPKEKVLATGDAAVNGPYNYTGDGNIGNWPSVIEKAQKLDVQYVLPGHGPNGGKEILDVQKAFFVELKAAVQRAIQDGKKLEDIVTLSNGSPKSTTIRLTDQVKRYVGDGFAGQVRDAYQELKAGQPIGGQPHP